MIELIRTPKYDKTIVKVAEIDTLTCCELLIKQGHNVVALNMACAKSPGGGVKYGSFCQEENCFRRSNYFQVLNRSLYPIPETGCIYSPIITVFKDKYYNLMVEPFNVSMIACAAIRKPNLNHDGQYTDPSD